MRRWASPVVAIVALLAGCAVPERPSPEASAALWSARQPSLAAFDTWDLRGRLSVKVGDNGGQASVRWRRQQNRQSFDLAAPLGRGMLRFSEDAAGAQARDAEGNTYSAPDLPALVFNLTGWYIPTARLQYWVRGLPAPDTPAEPKLDAAGRVQALEQDGWRVRIADYMQHQNLELPRRLFLTFAGSDKAPAVDLRFVIESWSTR